MLCLTRSGQNISAYCVTCLERIVTSAQFTIWRSGLACSHDNCQGKIVRIKRSGKELSAECLTCGETIAREHELKIQKQSILVPKVDLEPLNWKAC